MYHGDRSRKDILVEYGFRLPSARDNRPLTFEEFENRVDQVVYVSATPGPYELTKSAGVVVEQIIRPTGLTDPEIEVRPIIGQVDDLLHEIRLRCQESGLYSHWLLTEAQRSTFVDVEIGMEPLGLGPRAFDATLGRRWYRGLADDSLDGLRRAVRTPSPG